MNPHGIVAAILPVHILAGVLALAFGYTALAAAKGATLHRRSGLLFVVAMIAMSLSGALVAAIDTAGVSVSVVAGLITFYLVATGLITVRRRPHQVDWVDRAAMRFAIAIALLCFAAGLRVLASGTRVPEMYPSFMFGIVGLIAARGDARMIRANGLAGPKRIARHVWRMCFGMWIAAASFFWGPQRRVPEAIRIPALQAAAVLLPLAVMLYWLWRLRSRRASGGIAGHPAVGVPQ